MKQFGTKAILPNKSFYAAPIFSFNRLKYVYLNNRKRGITTRCTGPAKYKETGKVRMKHGHDTDMTRRHR
jgi:hypothetical protein